MEVLLAGQLTPDDRIPRPGRGPEEGWRNKTSWEVKDLKSEGLMVDTAVAGKGFWALSAIGLADADDAYARHGIGIPYRESTLASQSITTIAPFEVDPTWSTGACGHIARRFKHLRRGCAHLVRRRCCQVHQRLNTTWPGRTGPISTSRKSKARQKPTRSGSCV